jgi:hypothetical protein
VSTVYLFAVFLSPTRATLADGDAGRWHVRSAVVHFRTLRTQAEGSDCHAGGPECNLESQTGLKMGISGSSAARHLLALDDGAPAPRCSCWPCSVA